MYSLKHDKTRAASVLNDFKNEPSYEFFGEVILKINLIWDVKLGQLARRFLEQQEQRHY